MKKTFAFVLTVLFLLSCTACAPLEAHEYDSVSDYVELFRVNEFLCGLGREILFPLACDEDFDDTVERVEKMSVLQGYESYPYDEEYWSAVKPPLIDELQVLDFYLYWDLWLAGSARVECFLSVQYDEASFESEKQRIANIYGKFPIVYDTTSFAYPAYVIALGYYGHTSQYALLDEAAQVIHYVHLQIMPVEDLKIPANLRPIRYKEHGAVDGQEYCIF